MSQWKNLIWLQINQSSGVRPKLFAKETRPDFLKIMVISGEYWLCENEAWVVIVIKENSEFLQAKGSRAGEIIKREGTS